MSVSPWASSTGTVSPAGSSMGVVPTTSAPGTGYTPGTVNAPPIGYQLSQTAFPVYCWNGYTSGSVGSGPTNPTVYLEIGAGVSIGGYDLSTLAIGRLVNSGTKTWTTPGTYSWVCPPNITQVEVTLVGGGGAGANYTSGSAGGSGAGWVHYIATVVPGTTYTVVVGQGGAGAAVGVGGGTGGNSTFNGADGLATATGGGGGTSSTYAPGGGASCSFGSVPAQTTPILTAGFSGVGMIGIGAGAVGGNGNGGGNGTTPFNSAASNPYNPGFSSCGNNYGYGSGAHLGTGTTAAGGNGVAILRW